MVRLVKSNIHPNYRSLELYNDKKRDDTELSSGSKVSKLLSNLGTEEQKINLLEQLVDTFSENARYFLSLDDFTEDESHKKSLILFHMLMPILVVYTPNLQ